MMIFFPHYITGTHGGFAVSEPSPRCSDNEALVQPLAHGLRCAFQIPFETFTVTLNPEEVALIEEKSLGFQVTILYRGKCAFT